ncbi:phosphoribosylanthranilate isomerase [Marinicella sp. W31]|uniref:phosphoribosylanthranilate isomerase n=1 Tax=Marinicella sp. W31 TaxID=3023713 RepID=UPI003757B98C
MSHIFSKYCGITTIDDASLAQESGCDAIGLVLVAKSKRYIDLKQAKQIADHVRGKTQIVLLFADPKAVEVEQAIAAIEPDILQFHGYENAEFCSQWKLPYWKAVPMYDSHEIDVYLQQYQSAAAWLLDNYGHNKSGGSGEPFQWFRFPENFRKKLILAGGLTPQNVYQAIVETGALSVDVSSGIEAAPGIKSAEKMRLFIEQIRRYDN